MLKFVSFSGDNLETQINEWLANHSKIEIISTNVAGGSEWWPCYMILYKSPD